VNVTSNVFTPSVLTISVGDKVTWANSEGFHNVNGTTATYPENPESFSNSTGTGWNYSHTFNIPGVYNYQCDPHVGLGMVGQVIVEEHENLLTINFSEMNPHIGQDLWLRVEDIAAAILCMNTVPDTSNTNPVQKRTTCHGLRYLVNRSAHIPAE